MEWTYIQIVSLAAVILSLTYIGYVDAELSKVKR